MRSRAFRAVLLVALVTGMMLPAITAGARDASSREYFYFQHFLPVTEKRDVAVKAWAAAVKAAVEQAKKNGIPRGTEPFWETCTDPITAQKNTMRMSLRFLEAKRQDAASWQQVLRVTQEEAEAYVRLMSTPYWRECVPAKESSVLWEAVLQLEGAIAASWSALP